MYKLALILIIYRFECKQIFLTFKLPELQTNHEASFRCTVNRLYNGSHYNSKILYNIILTCTKIPLLLKICILYNSKFSLTSKYLGAKKVHYFFISSPV